MLASVFAKTTRDRWKGMAIAMFSLGLLLWMVMAVYQDIDISAYSELPEVFLSIMGIPEGADVASLAVGVMYGFYGALTLAGLAVSMGSASVAGEERDWNHRSAARQPQEPHQRAGLQSGFDGVAGGVGGAGSVGCRPVDSRIP